MCDSVEFRQKTDECAERPLTYCLLETSLCTSLGWRGLCPNPRVLFFQNSADYVPPWAGLVFGGTLERTLAVQSSFMPPPVSCAISRCFIVRGEHAWQKATHTGGTSSLSSLLFSPPRLPRRSTGERLVLGEAVVGRIPGHEGVETAPHSWAARHSPRGNLSRRWCPGCLPDLDWSKWVGFGTSANEIWGGWLTGKPSIVR